MSAYVSCAADGKRLKFYCWIYFVDTNNYIQSENTLLLTLRTSC